MALSQFLNREFQSSTTQTDEFKEFARNYKKALKGHLPKGTKIVSYNRGHFCISGFVSDGEKFVYFSCADVRFFPNAWAKNILVRTAKDTKDFTGGINHYTTLEEFGRAVEKLLN
jgi:hypothetical protein